MPDFNLIHSKEYDREVSLVAFDMLEKDGEDLRPLPLLERKRRLQHLTKTIGEGIEFAEHLDGDGADIYKAACRLGHEGIVAKRKDLPYESGRSKRWVKIKNPASPAMKRVLDEGLLWKARPSSFSLNVWERHSWSSRLRNTIEPTWTFCRNPFSGFVLSCKRLAHLHLRRALRRIDDDITRT
jgi:hypothetical protein